MSGDTVGVVADDLTGAGDCVVQFARAGWPSHLVLGSEPPAGERAALALVTDARPQDDAAAAHATAAAVRTLADAGAGRLYLKIDSTMRGSVPGQVAGALDAWRTEHPAAFAVVCPGYPALGRTVRDGVLRVDGTPVAESAAGRDPVTPVRDSDLTRLLPGAVRVPDRIDGADGAKELAVRLADAGRDSDVVVVDAVDDADLDHLAEALALLGPLAVPVGSAGLAAALAPRWGGTTERPEPDDAVAERVVVVLSSLHEVSLRQVDELVRAGPDARTTLARTPAPVPGATGREQAERAASTLADTVADVVARTRPDALVLLGGDGARAVLARLGARSVRVTGSVAEGVPLGRLVGGPADGTVVVTKAGGFGTDRTVVDVLAHLRRTVPTRR
ncbi:four-carbon acid sugar kinase family protein [Promicromonospora thailandica]|uniref:Uncharacterized conserved protein YgbK, DUF1537 family n=1 Tax=Promicromonospora thailandica TaxID=765201 RepID=A0A9X2GF67_9MICO|nr:four-carbon acid sugar kinase family protein [Promicromonospora thailandica]MCP2267456.1 Uncharacterized conserved protein YgbK, DUF1537 family [Promicromonospora thailandica]BFF21289.1 four-carbon acid sugar kinase family protein [Promicromonospora thailandica]